MKPTQPRSRTAIKPTPTTTRHSQPPVSVASARNAQLLAEIYSLNRRLRQDLVNRRQR